MCIRTCLHVVEQQEPNQESFEKLKLMDAFEPLEDARRLKSCDYPLLELLLTAIQPAVRVAGRQAVPGLPDRLDEGRVSAAGGADGGDRWQKPAWLA